MMFRILLAFCLFSTAASVTLVICQQYCSSVQGAASYDNCAPWNSYALASNQTCYNLCVHNCAAVYDGSCMTGDGFRCCLKTTPTKTQEFKTSGCNKLYNNLPGMNFRKGTILNQRYVYEQFAGSYYNVLSFNAFDKQKDEQVLVKGYAMNDPRVNAHVTFFERCDGIKGVPKMVEVFDMDGNTFIVLGHEGIPLGSILRDSLFHCSMENTYRIGFRLFRIIHSVHRHNFVIRDIRPQSIRCMVDDSEELQVSLSNFGLSAPISPPPLQPSGDNPIANGMFQSLSAIRGNPYVPIDDYIAVVFVMLDCQGVNPFNANANQHMTLLQKKERFHSNPYGFLPEACQWIADIYLLLEGMREDGNFKHIDVMSLLNKAVPGVKAQSAITFRHNPANGHLLID